MKLLNTALMTFLFFISNIVCGQQTLGANSEEPAKNELLKFEKMSYEIGAVKKGDKKIFEIPFVNSGSDNVMIDFVSSCDCTTVEFPTYSIKPGEKGILKVTFNSAEKTESETIDMDVFLKNKDKETGSQIYYTLQYSYKLVK